MKRLLFALAACSSSPDAPPGVVATAPATPLPDAAPPAPAKAPEVWLKGSTHVHAKASGDSKTPIPEVIEWYEARGYDFIVITDHNQVSELDTSVETTGKPWLRDPSRGLLVLSGIEWTQNINGCRPAGDPSNKCRIHMNQLGVTARPRTKLKGWITQGTERLALYGTALDAGKDFGGIVQVNHPQWFWGMNEALLVELAKRGVVLYEVWNKAFAKWNPGDADHPSTDALWDAALMRGATLWGVASDDAHHYNDTGKYPAGGAWVSVKARRDPQAILDALRAGQFYASTGVVLERADVERGELVVEISAADPSHSITFIENGKRTTVSGKTARRPVPVNGYVRAVVERADGARAWTQPARR